MSRLTGKEVYSLMEAYQAVYAPQELTEEQVWEGVENWVQSLLEEGYDLSDYTWEEMYESYLSEGPYDAANVKSAQQAAQDGQVKRDAAAAALKAQTRSQDVADYRKAMLPPPVKTFQNTAGDGRYQDPKTQNQNQSKYKSTSDGKMYANYNDALAANRSRNRKTDTPTPARPAAPANSSSPTTTAPSSSPITTAPALSTKPDQSKIIKSTNTAGSAMDQWAKANPRLAAAQAEKDRIRGTSQTDNPLMKDMKDRMPMTPSVQSPTLAKDLGGGSGNQSLLDNPNASKAATPKKPIVSGFDMFDVMKGYLIGEGYADTQEAALAIMGNMSEGWRQSIISEGPNYDKNRQRAAKRAAERNEARKRGQTGNVPGIGYVSPRPERETYRDAAGVERHTSGARMPKKDEGDK